MLQTPFLDRLSPQARDVLDTHLTLRHVAPNGMVISQDEPTRDAFLVLSGRAQVTIYSDDGKMVSYRQIGPGSIFGEIAAIDGGRRSASVVALDDLVVGVLVEARFRAIVSELPEFAWALLEHLATQSRAMTARIYEFSTMLVRDRLIEELLRLAAEAPAPAVDAGQPAAFPGAREIAPAPTHFDLAARISTHREAVSREMSKFAKLGIVVKRAGGLVVRDIEALRALRTDRLE